MPRRLAPVRIEHMFEGLPGACLDRLCADPVTTRTDDVEVLGRIEALERLRAVVDAEQSIALCEFAFRRCSVDDDFGASVGDEVGLALRIAPRTADSRVEVATQLVERLPATVATMRRGDMTVAKARVVLEEAHQLSAADTARVE